MFLNIVTVSSGWILQKISQRIKENNTTGDVIEVSHSPNPNADANFYADLQNCYFGYKTKLDVAYFTHADMNSEDWLINLMRQRNGYGLDGIVSMNQRYTDMLERIGYPKEKLITIVPGQTYDTFPLKKIKIGIVSRGGYEGYGQFFMERLFNTQNLENFEFNFLGSGWDALVNIARNKNISINVKDDKDYSIYPAFYHYIDYLLIPGLWTAGPMSMQEALSCGVPIIGADVGFVNYEFKADYVFPPNDINALVDILNSIIEPNINRRRQVENMRWSKYSEELLNFIKAMRKV